MTRICPDCAAALAPRSPLECAGCGWRGETRDGIPVYLSNADRTDPLMADYMANYDEICTADITEAIMGERFLANIATKTAGYVRAPEGKRVLDIGVGRGLLAEALLARGASSVTGVDISLGYLERLADKPGIEPVLANAENLPFANTFDIAFATDVMEHVLNVGSFLYAMNRALKPGGRVYIRVPFEEDLLMYSPHLGCEYRLVHLRSFDRRLIRLFLRNAGFTVERIIPDGFWLHLPARFWLLTPFLERTYDRFEEAARARLDDPADVELWAGPIARLFMRPVEMLVVARKTGVIEPDPARRGLVRKIERKELLGIADPVAATGRVGSLAFRAAGDGVLQP